MPPSSPRRATSSRRDIRKSLRTDFNPSARLRLIRAAHQARRATRFPSLLFGVAVERPIFIVGAPRSGTSLLYAILRRSSELRHWPGESHEIWEADVHPATRGWDSNALDARDASPEIAARIKRSFFLVTGKKHRLLDKTPRNALRVPFVDAIFPDATYIYLRRDGRENVNSLINAWRTPRYRTYELPEPHAIPGVDPKWWKFVLYPGWRDDKAGPIEIVCARQWIASNEHLFDARERISRARWIDIRYEDLVDRPEEEVGRLMDELGLAYEPGVRAKATATSSTPINVVTPPEPGKWRRENRAEIERITELIAPTMERLGYDVED